MIFVLTVKIWKTKISTNSKSAIRIKTTPYCIANITDLMVNLMPSNCLTHDGNTRLFQLDGGGAGFVGAPSSESDSGGERGEDGR